MKIRISSLCAVATIAAPVLSAYGNERLTILPTDGSAGAEFGRAVAAADRIAVLGDRALYLFHPTTGAQVAKLWSSDGQGGTSVAAEGNTVLLGYSSADAVVTNAGAVYVFDSSTGQEVRKLVAIDGAQFDFFGWSVAIAGNTIVVGAPGDDDNGSLSGSAYLFNRATGQPTFKLVPVDGGPGHTFGVSVATNGTLVVVGAQGTTTGAVYVYNVATGQPIYTLHAADGEALDHFGYDVAISGNTAVIGAAGDDDDGEDSGSAYLFDVVTGQQLAKLLPTDGSARANFGRTVAIGGGRALVGRWSFDPAVVTSGAYLFDAVSGRQLAKLQLGNPVAGVAFGADVAIGGANAVVGAAYSDVNGRNSGAAYVFQAALQFGAAFCDASDGTLAACPCTNPGSSDTGCDLSQGTGGVELEVLTQTTAPVNHARMTGTGYPPGQITAIAIRSAGLLPGGAAVFGDGVRCLDAPFARLASTFADGGVSTHFLGHLSTAGPGTFYYQLYFRNGPAAFCDPTAAFNLSNATALVW